MSSTLTKIHVTNSTGLSLNERFTAISSQPKVLANVDAVGHIRGRSRSRSVQRKLPTATKNNESSRANQRLLAQLQRKHKMQTALKLKRRSMRTVGGVSIGNGVGRIRRGSVKAIRVGANGKPIRANSLAHIATMKADNEVLNNNNNRSLRRSGSSGNLAGRLGPRRPTVGGAAQRVAKRNLDRQRRRNNLLARGRGSARSFGISGRGRSRSRSRTRALSGTERNRSRSRSRTRNPDNQNNERSRPKNRSRNDGVNTLIANIPRGRSRSRSRGRGGRGINKLSLPVKARLGERPGTVGQKNMRRNASLTRRGVQTGRVQKRRNSKNPHAVRATSGDINGRGRVRSRSATRNIQSGGTRRRSRSRTRKGLVGQNGKLGSGQAKQQQRRTNRAPRGRNQQRRGNNKNTGQRRGTNNNGKMQTQQRRGRSRSRSGRGINGTTRNQGTKTKPAVNKDDLDKELDQYMATTKTENEMDYLLKD